MTRFHPSDFEADLADQAEALSRFADQNFSDGLRDLDPRSFERIILTGMGSSDTVTIPFELALARRGLPVWRIQTSTLLERPEMITSRTLLWVTSQSGRSGEIVALLPTARRQNVARVVAVTNDPDSPLGAAADQVIPLLSGPEATVSCKSYLNSLACFDRVVDLLDNASDDASVARIRAAASVFDAGVPALRTVAEEIAGRIMADSAPRLALIGRGADAATALTGALILKEAAKIPAEGYAGGAFRHGPMELSGPGLVAIIFADDAPGGTALDRLAAELSETGSIIVGVAGHFGGGTEHVWVRATSQFGRLVGGMSFVQQLSVSLARSTGIVPGEFRFGRKITTDV